MLFYVLLVQQVNLPKPTEMKSFASNDCLLCTFFSEKSAVSKFHLFGGFAFLVWMFYFYFFIEDRRLLIGLS